MADELENASEALLSFKNGVIKTEIKEEAMEEFGPASLGLHRVGEVPPPKPQPSSQPLLNRRGMPARIRKKNRLFFDDETPVSSVVPRSMLKTPRVKTSTKRGRKPKEPPEPTPPRIESGDRKLGQKIGMRLRNLLKLPKAHKWVCYEWFYSNIDTALFGGENDFTICLKESFPQLKTYMLSRVEWCKMRRMMGKPRRCSQAFFEEERKELDRKRAKIRQLQQRKPTDLNSCKDLPPEIPLQLVIGTKVTARLRSPQDGLFCGSIDAFDTSNNTYRITFERQGLGTHSIPDFEVLANEPVETISVMSMAHALRPIKHSGANSVDPIYGSQSDAKADVLHSLEQQPSNGFPTSALEHFVQLNKIIELKRSKVSALREMNTEAERKQNFSEFLTEEFVKRYATSIIEIDQINIALRQLLSSVQQLCQQLLPDMSMVAMLTPNYLRNQSLEEAKSMVDRFNCSVSNSVLDLVIELTALVIQIKSLSENDRSSFEVEVLTRSMETIKKKLSPKNKNMFENNIEVHMKKIQCGLSGEIGPFHTVLLPTTQSQIT